MNQPTLMEADKMPGIWDLAPAVRLLFAKAYLAELGGNLAEAREQLAKAVHAEDELSMAKMPTEATTTA